MSNSYYGIPRLLGYLGYNHELEDKSTSAPQTLGDCDDIDFIDTCRWCVHIIPKVRLCIRATIATSVGISQELLNEYPAGSWTRALRIHD